MPEIQATLTSAAPGPYTSMMRANYAAFTALTIGYIGVASSGFSMFGVGVEDNVLMMISNPAMATVTNLLVFFHVIASYQVYARVAMEAIERQLKRIFPTAWPIKHDRVLFAWFRTSYLFVMGALAATIPFFGSIMGILGAFGFTPTSFVVPSILVLVYYRNGKNGGISTWYWLLNWFLVIYFSSTTIMAGISSIRSINDAIQSAQWFS